MKSDNRDFRERRVTLYEIAAVDKIVNSFVALNVRLTVDISANLTDGLARARKRRDSDRHWVRAACVAGITSRWKDVVKHYIRSKRFVADVVSVLPLRLPCFMYTCNEKLIALLRFNQLIKLSLIHI